MTIRSRGSIGPSEAEVVRQARASRIARLRGKEFYLNDVRIRTGDRLSVIWADGTVTTEEVRVVAEITAGHAGPGGWRGAGWPCWRIEAYSNYRGETVTHDLMRYDVSLVPETAREAEIMASITPVKYCFDCAWDLPDACICETIDFNE